MGDSPLGRVNGSIRGFAAGAATGAADLLDSMHRLMSALPLSHYPLAEPGFAHKIRPHAAEECAQLACLGFGDPKMAVIIGLSGKALDNRLSLGGERRDMSAAIIGIRHSNHEARGLQPIEQANEHNRPDAQNSSQGRLIDPFVVSEMNEDGASCVSHTRKSSANLSLAASAQ